MGLNNLVGDVLPMIDRGCDSPLISRQPSHEHRGGIDGHDRLTGAWVRNQPHRFVVAVLQRRGRQPGQRRFLDIAVRPGADDDDVRGAERDGALHRNRIALPAVKEVATGNPDRQRVDVRER